MKTRYILIIILTTIGGLHALPVPEGCSIPTDTASPNEQYGVTIPLLKWWQDRAEETAAKNHSTNIGVHIDAVNSVIEMKSGKLIGTIAGETAIEGLNGCFPMPAQWSKDSTLLLWEVGGRRCHDSMVLLHIESGKIDWQIDILKQAQKVILARTKAADPNIYEKACRENSNWGSDAYPDGFTIDVNAIDPIQLPLKIKVDLSSGPKSIEDSPTLESHLEGLVNSKGMIVIKSFHIGK